MASDQEMMMTPFMESVALNREFPQAPLRNRKTKIIATIGPASQSIDILVPLLSAGMNVARLNFSHGNHEYHAQTIANIREAAMQTGLPVAILLDTKGPEIRTTKLNLGLPVQVTKGSKLILKCTHDPMFQGDAETIGVDYLNLPRVLSQGDIIKLDDGLISLVVISVNVDGGLVNTLVQNSGEIGQNKGVNLPNVVVDLPAITDKDRSDILFGVSQGIDFVAASFARKGDDIHHIRSILGEKGSHIRIIAKVENIEGLDNFDSILAASDGIMVARGDLGVEIPIEKVCMAQKQMIHKCNIAGKTVVTATQMLESMVKNPRPTRAEATDVANAVFDGTDCVMLSGETAKGMFPIAAVETMARICESTELTIDFTDAFLSVFHLTPRPLSRPEAVSSAGVKCVVDLDASLVIVLTESGDSARYVAKYKPLVPVLTVSSSQVTLRQTMAVRNLWPLLAPAESSSDEDLVQHAISHAKFKGWVEVDDWVVIISGTSGVSGSAHTLKVVRVL